jgi:hypothetical protein
VKRVKLLLLTVVQGPSVGLLDWTKCSWSWVVLWSALCAAMTNRINMERQVRSWANRGDRPVSIKIIPGLALSHYQNWKIGFQFRKIWQNSSWQADTWRQDKLFTTQTKLLQSISVVTASTSASVPCWTKF